METAIPLLLNTLTYVSILFLVALGLAVIFGMMDIVNLAHGEFITVGAYTVAITQLVFGLDVGRSSFWLGLLLAPFIGAAIGLILEALVIRPLYKRPLDTLLATYAVSLILQKGIVLIFGARPQIVIAPMTEAISIFGVDYPAYRLVIIAVTAVITACVFYVFARTRFGTDLRAVIQDPAMAEAVGINTRRLNRTAFALGAGLAALAGALVAPMASVEAHLGIFYLGKAFFVIILGGIGSVLGALVGSGFVGTVETLLSYRIDPSLASALVLVMAIMIIRFRPQGLVPGFSHAHRMLGKD